MPRSFFGVVSASDLTPSEFQTLGRGRVGTLRALLVWDTVEPTPGARNWAPFDSTVESAALQGIQVLPTLFGSPSFAADRVSRPPQSPAALAAWSAFVSDAVHRYGNGGTFWQQFAADHPGVPALPVKDWQVWNEVSSPTYWLPHPRGQQYAHFLRSTTPAIHTADPSAKVVLAGLFPHPTLVGTVPPRKFFRGFFKVRGVNSLFDAAAVHPYAHAPGDPLRQVKAMRKLLKSNAAGKKPIFVTEVGWATGGQQTPYTTSFAGQARNLQITFTQLARNAKKLRIGGVIWFALRDAAGSDVWINRTGLFDAAGVAKPSWSSFVSFTGGTP